jgi:hypothetical protein
MPATATQNPAKLADVIDWKIVQLKWDKITRKYNEIQKVNTGTVDSLMYSIAELLNGPEPECVVEIKSGDIKFIQDYRNPTTKNLKYPNDGSLFWTIEPAGILDENGTDIDEMFGAIEYLIERNQTFKVEISYYDPTPMNIGDLEIGSMF